MSLTIDALKSELISRLGEASCHVDILSSDLQPDLLDNEDVVRCLTALARRGPNTVIRIIVTDPKPIMERGHALWRLAKRLTTAISVRVLREHPEWNGQTSVTVDSDWAAMVATDGKTCTSVDTRPLVQTQRETFDRLWRAGIASPELKQF